ncbi:hypothetical protein Syncc8109_2479 [Synechococcus sp. WH 8109]|uniref:hypothetical protein n=1 Tax=Synechococcus sp. WH 8109 TaxID=166314 RepID=UPI0001B8D32B|nr:hypothetical protein [Synechococcus sp. WH 8109]AHF64787.1 hypothetical protein Syncc8109_2479 [Synechococcus sp. WH 8109]
MSIRHLSSKISLKVVFIIYIAITLVGVSSHVLWRDEMQGWLVAVGSSNIFELWNNNAPSGHPIVYPLLTFISSLIYENPLSLQLMQWSLAATCVFVFLSRAPFSKFQKLLFAFGYFPFWEYCLISRHYVVIQLLTFVGVIYVSKRKYSLVGISFLIALLLNTHALAWSIAIGFFITVADDTLYKRLRKGEREFSSVDSLNYLASAIVVFIATWLSLNSLFQTSRSIDSASIGISLKSILVAFGRYLGGNILIVPNSSRWIDLSVSAAVSVALMLTTILYIRCSRKALLFYCSSTFCLLCFNAAVYSGAGSRHFGIYFIIIMASVWLCRSDLSVSCSSSGVNVKQSYLIESKSRFSLFLSIILVIHFFAGIHRVFLDIVYPYSASKEVATFIRNSEYANWPLFGSRDVELASVSGYLGKSIYYPEINRLGTFAEWVNRNSSLSRENSLDYIQEYMDSHPNNNSLLVILSNSSKLKHDFGRGHLELSDDITIEFVKSFLRSYNKPERYHIYKVGRVKALSR